MERKYLIADGSMRGSTAEFAQSIGEEMRQGGAQMEVQPVETVNDLRAYDTVIVGSAVRIGSLTAKPMLIIQEPVSLGMFGGCLDPDKLTGYAAVPFKNKPVQDHRDWEKMRAWGSNLLPLLSENA